MLHNEAFFFNHMKTEQLYQIFRESRGVSTDSRTVEKGQIFFALWGEKYNGNEFAAEALDKGASWAVIDDPAFETDRSVLVDDTLIELQALATHYRKELKIPVLAVTGTNGKTTTRELITEVAKKKYRVHGTTGNLNNSIGVPLTILAAPPDTQLMVIEMGANHLGEIRSLCLIARPDYGIITNVGTSHIEGFGSLDGVLKAKTELYEYLRKVNGIAIYNDRDPVLKDKIFKLVNRAVPISDPTGVDLEVVIVSDDLNLVVEASFQNRTHNIKTNLFGRYNLENIKTAIATGLFLEVDMEDIVAAITDYSPVNNRSQVKVTKHNTIVCDSYNANPSSMKLALESFGGIKAERKMVILGDMLELGDRTDAEHITVLEEVYKMKDTEVLLAGTTFAKYADDYGFKAFPDVNSLADHIRSKPVKGYSILVKGSRGIALEKTYDLL